MASALPARLYSTARPVPVPAVCDTPVSNARTEDRQPVSAGGMVVANQSELQPVTIADLSRHGCCLEGDCVALRPGQFISVRISKLDRLAAIVRWVDGNRAGVEFTRALEPQALEEHMRQLLPE